MLTAFSVRLPNHEKTVQLKSHIEQQIHGLLFSHRYKTNGNEPAKLIAPNASQLQ